MQARRHGDEKKKKLNLVAHSPFSRHSRAEEPQRRRLIGCETAMGNVEVRRAVQDSVADGSQLWPTCLAMSARRRKCVLLIGDSFEEVTNRNSFVVIGGRSEDELLCFATFRVRIVSQNLVVKSNVRNERNQLVKKRRRAR